MHKLTGIPVADCNGAGMSRPTACATSSIVIAGSGDARRRVEDPLAIPATLKGF
jgi:hypothetical protein